MKKAAYALFGFSLVISILSLFFKPFYDCIYDVIQAIFAIGVTGWLFYSMLPDVKGWMKIGFMATFISETIWLIQSGLANTVYLMHINDKPETYSASAEIKEIYALGHFTYGIVIASVLVTLTTHLLCALSTGNNKE